MASDGKKVLIITTVSGFLTHFELENVKLLQTMGYEVHYASNFRFPVYLDNCNLYDLGIKVHPISIRKSPLSVCANVKAYFELKRLLQKEKFTMVHCHNPMGGVLGRLANPKLKNHSWMIYTSHGFHFYKGAPLINWILYYSVEKGLAHRTDCLITINQENYAYAKRFHLRKRGFPAYIPGVGLDVARFNEKSSNMTREQMGIPEEALFVLSVGEVNRNKNHIVIIRALGMLKDSSIVYGIIGTGSLKYRNKLEAEAKKCGIEHQIYFFGYKDNVADFLHLADVFAFPSYREGLGMAALEAMASGLPLITSDNCGSREYMIDGISGIMVPPDDIQGFAKAILKMKNPAYRIRTGENCRKQADKFSKIKASECMRHIYQECERRMEYGT